MADYIALQYFVFLQKDLATSTTNEGWSFLISGILRTIRSSKHLRHPKRREINKNDCHKSLEERLIRGKYREAPKIDYGVKHKASLLIMRIYTCVLMLYIKAGVAVLIQSIHCLNSRVSLCFVNARLYVFLLLM